MRALLLLASLLAPTVALAAPTTYALSSGPNQLAVLVKYQRGTAAAGMGHDHILTPTDFTGRVTWDPENIAGCAIEIGFPATNLAVDPPGARALAGLDGDTSASDATKIRENALGDRQLKADVYQNIRFRSTSCAVDGDKALVHGTLSIHGVDQPVSVPMEVTADGATFAAKGRFSLGHSDFGLKPFSALLGALKNDERLTFLINVKGAAK